MMNLNNKFKNIDVFIILLNYSYNIVHDWKHIYFIEKLRRVRGNK
jgi:hypothetical protein